METRYNILCVDDEEDNLLVFRSYFRKHYTVFTAQSGQEALELLKTQPVDLIVSDQRMPHMTGVELFEHIREAYPDAIRIILTGYSDIQAVIGAINKGKVYHYATKPWDGDELKNILDRALDAYTLRQHNRRLVEENMELLLRTERQEKANILSQFELLKSQINPHFLFNSMNILAALIPQDTAQAIEFTHRFSKVYRKLLELREQPLVELEQELDFAASYLFLQKMRFADSLQVETEVPAAFQRHCLPPFTLQILLENAVKHNVVSAEQPLQIRIGMAPDGKLEVTNNLQLRGSPVESTHLGLDILKTRYQLITPEQVEFEKTEQSYIVRVPLIESG
ncbi:MAG TPA: response regulator [Saprospiraceae bacterium]|nr:response regulator [Saprospiraceae bacterium]